MVFVDLFDMLCDEDGSELVVVVVVDSVVYVLVLYDVGLVVIDVNGLV